MLKVSLEVTIDERTADRARRYSARHGISISKVVGDFLSRLPMDDDPCRPVPATIAYPADRYGVVLYAES